MIHSLSPRLYADLMGKPFADGARGPEAFDCWGVLQEIMRRQGFGPTDYPSDPAMLSTALAEEWDFVGKSSVLPGDAILLRSADSEYIWHVGVIVDLCRMLHVRRAANVCLERFDSPLYSRRIVGFYRFRGRAIDPSI